MDDIDEVKSNCGAFARQLQAWAWNTRQFEEHRQWSERLAGLIAIPLIAKTYTTDFKKSRELLQSVINVIGDPGFPVDCVYRLSNEAQSLIVDDPDLVVEIYEHVFGYEERSDEKTNMGGAVLPLISNRRQDYDMCRYSLTQVFPQFLAESPLLAVKAGVRAVQAFSIRNHIFRYSSAPSQLDDTTETFKFRNSIVTYVHDGSAIWGGSSYPDREIVLADEIFNLLARPTPGLHPDKFEDLFAIFAGEFRLAFFWARLLSAAATNPELLTPYCWELATAKPILEGADCLYAVGSFLEVAPKFLSPSQRARIEGAILNLGSEHGEKKDEQWFATRRRRLIARIPQQLLITNEAQQLRESLESSGDLPANPRPFSYSPSWSRVSEDEILRYKGAKPELPENIELRALYEPIRAWNDGSKSDTEIDQLLPTALAIRKYLSSENGADVVIQRAAECHLTQFASDALLKTSDSASERFVVLRDFVLNASKSSDPEPDSERDAAWDSAVWSPAPRIEAAQALPWLTHFGRDVEAFEAIKNLSKDPVPSVRFLLACDLWRVTEHFSGSAWEILEDMADSETNGIVLQGISVSLTNLVHRDRPRVLALIKKLMNRDPEEESDDDDKMRSRLICMIVDYAVWHDDDWCKETLQKWNISPVENAASLSIAGRRLIDHINPQHIGLQLDRARILFIEQLKAIGKGLSSLQNDSLNLEIEVGQKKWRFLYGVIDSSVMRIYFAADIDPKLRQRSEFPLNDEQRSAFFCDVLPILETILNFGKQKATGFLLAPTAHHFMELLNGVLAYNTPLVLRMATDVVTCSSRFGYNMDSMAMRETVKLVERILADHRYQIQDDISIRNLLELLDAFVEAGWPEALNLVWRLDEIYR